MKPLKDIGKKLKINQAYKYKKINRSELETLILKHSSKEINQAINSLNLNSVKNKSWLTIPIVITLTIFLITFSFAICSKVAASKDRDEKHRQSNEIIFKTSDLSRRLSLKYPYGFKSF